MRSILIVCVLSLLLLNGCARTTHLSEDLLESDVTTYVEKANKSERHKPRPDALKAHVVRKKIPKHQNFCAPVQQAFKNDVFKPGEKIKITVYREEELSGFYEIDRKGHIVFPLIGEVKAAGLTVAQLQDKIGTSLANGYLVNPQVSVVTARCLDGQ